MPFLLSRTDSTSHSSRSSRVRWATISAVATVAALAGLGAVGIPAGASTSPPAPKPPVTVSAYWSVASDGGVFAFGGVHFYGSTGNIHLNKPMVGMAATSPGLGARRNKEKMTTMTPWPMPNQKNAAS